MNKTTTKTEEKTETLSHWPPVVHLLDYDVPIRPGSRAICGAKILGIYFPRGTAVTCKECKLKE